MADSTQLNVERFASTAVDAANPWPGLESYTESTRQLFFGRENETDELFRLVHHETLTVLFGQSGLGKSSLIQAGLFPLLREADHLPLYLRLDHSTVGLPIGDSPTLADQVRAALSAACASAKADAPGFRVGETLWEYFHRKDVDLWSAKNRLLTPVLAFDQFEEIFTLGRADAARSERSQAFLYELACLVENRPPAAVKEKFDRGELDPARFTFQKPSCHVILSLREDFLPDLEALKQDMPALIHNRLRLKRLNGTQALEIVTKPAPHLLADGVPAKIVEFVAGARGGSAERLAELDVEPALLSVICRELNERRRALGQTQITADLVSGNRREILNDFYERSVADLPAPMRGFVEDRLLTKSGFRDNLALETALEEPGVTQPLIDTLVSRRLLRLEDRAGIQRVELTHDVLAEVIRASRDARQQRLALEAADRRERLAREEAEKQRQIDLAAAAHQTRRQRWIISGLAAVVLALCATGLYGLRQRRLDLQRNSRTDVATASRQLEEGRTAEGIAHLLRAARRDPHNPAIAPRLASLLTSRNFLLPEGAAVTHPSPVLWTDFSADGKSAGVLWQDGAHASIDLATGEEQRWQLPSPPYASLKPIATRGFIVLRCQDGVTRLLNKAGQMTREIRYEAAPRQGPDDTVTRSNPGDFFYSLRVNNTLVLTNAATGRMLPLDFFENDIFPMLTEKWIAWRDAPGGDVRGLVNEARLRDTETGTTEVTLRAPFGGYRWVPSPTGRQVAAVQRESANRGYFLQLYSLPDGAPLAPARPIEGAGEGRSTQGWTLYSPDGRFFVTWIGALMVWDGQTGARIAGIPTAGSASASKLPRFSPDSRTLATYSNLGSLDLWDLASGKAQVPPMKHRGNVLDVSFSADSRALISTATDGLVRVWDAATGQLLAEPTLQQRTAPVAAISPDRTQVIIGTRDGALYRFRIGHGQAKSLVLPRTPQLTPPMFLPGAPSRLLQLWGDRARVIDAATGGEVSGGFAYPEPLGDRYASGVRVRTDSKVMMVKTASGAWQAWWLGEGKVEKAVPLAEPPPVAAAVYTAFSTTGDRVVLAWRGILRVWNLRTGQPVGPAIATTISGSTPRFAPGVNLSPDGARVTVGSNTGNGSVWDSATGKEVLAFGEQGTLLEALLFSPDGRRLATANNSGEVQLWDSRTGEPASPVLLHNSSITSMSNDGAGFSPDGNLLSHSVDGVLRIWEGTTGAPIGEPISLGLGTVQSARFSTDGRRIVTGSSDDQARLWDVRSGLAAAEPLVHGQGVRNAWFSPDGRFVSTSTTDGVFHLWSVPPPLPAGDKTPEWLLDLAAICAGKTLNEDGQFVTDTKAFGKIADLRRTLAGLPDDAPYVEWGRWFLADRATRSVAPGFTITAAEAEKLAGSMAATPATTPPTATPRP